MDENNSQSVKKRILVVDDSQALRTVLRDVLEEENYEVETAEDGKVASTLHSQNKYDIILSDIRMPNLSGIELLHFVKKTNPVPVILMTGFAEITEAHEAIELGALGFLAKPFKKNELIDLLNTVLPDKNGNISKKTAIEQSLDLDFCKIPIDDFISGNQIKFNIYIRIAENKYIKIAHCGEDISLDKIRTFKSKGLNYLYLAKNDFKKYINFNMHLSKAVTESKNIDDFKKVSFLKKSAELLTSSMFTSQINQDDFDHASSIVENIVSITVESENMFSLLKIMSSHSENLYAHSLAVSVFSVLLSKKLGWTSSVMMSKISLAGLLHDIGKKEIDQQIISKKRIEMSSEDIKLYESHPVRGAEILNQIEGIPEEIIQAVLQHHENDIGTGFPFRLNKHRIQTIAKVISLVDAFVNLSEKENLQDENAAQKIFSKMDMLYKDVFDEKYVEAFKSIFNI